MEWFKIFVSWPFVALIIAGAIYVRFGDEIRALLNRIATAENFEGPGGIKFSGSRQQPSANVDAANPNARPVDAPLPAPPQDTDAGNFVFTQAQWAATEDAFKSLRAAAAHWEYRYLAYFLAPKTQQFLDWLIGLGRGANEREVDTVLNGNPIGQRKAMLDALEAHHLILRTGDMYSVTDKGREYVDYRGPLQPIAQA